MGRRWLGIVITLALLCLGPAVLLWTFFGFGLVTASLAVLCGLGLWITLLFRAERLLLRAHEAGGPITGAEASLARALYERGVAPAMRPPVIRVFSDPAPNLVVLRAPRGSGTLLVSEGLLALLDERELRAVLARGFAELVSPGMALRTFAAAVATLLLARAPQGWRDAVLTARTPESPRRKPMTVPDFLLFALLLGVASCFVRAFARAELPEPEGLEFADARRKVLRASSRWGLRWSPGAARLYLFPPLPGPQADLMSWSWT